MKKTKSKVAVETKPIVQEKGVTSIENLPYPIIHYPNWYGHFICFQLEKDQPLYFCSCTKNAIENYFTIHEKHFNIYKSIITAFEGAGSKPDFPKALLTELRRKKTKTAKDFLENIKYAKSICHECNGKLPTFRYSGGYGSTFEQNYGWYLYKQAYEYGVNSIGNIKLADSCPQEIRDLVTITDDELELIEMEYQELRKVNEYKARNYIYKAHQPLRKQQKRIMNYIENIVRDKFGHKKIGEAWINETMLYYIVSTLYPEKTILRHHHPAFLNGLELDIYFPNEKIGIEYQGIQHFEPIDHWGGMESLKKSQERDKLKKELCKANQINLIYFLHSEILSDSLVEQKIKEYMI